MQYGGGSGRSGQQCIQTGHITDSSVAFANFARNVSELDGTEERLPYERSQRNPILKETFATGCCSIRRQAELATITNVIRSKGNAIRFAAVGQTVSSSFLRPASSKQGTGRSGA